MTYTNPRIPTPAGMATATAAQVFDALALNVDDADIGEAAQRSFIVRVLAALGHSHAPEILTSMLDGSRVRLYHWKDSPAGDFILVTGPQFKGKLVRPGELVERDDGFYLRAVPDQSKAAESVLKAAASGRAEAQRAANAMHKAELQAAAREARETRERAPRQRKPQAPSMEAAIPVMPHVAEAPAAAPRAPRPPRTPRAPRAVVAPEVADAFGLEGMPNVDVMDEQSDEEAAAGLAAKFERMFE